MTDQDARDMIIQGDKRSLIQIAIFLVESLQEGRKPEDIARWAHEALGLWLSPATTQRRSS